MRKIKIGDKDYSLGEHDYINVINNIVEGDYNLSETYNKLHSSGFANLYNYFRYANHGQREFLSAILNQVDDSELSIRISSFRNHIIEMKNVDKLIIKWLASYANFPFPETRKEKKLLGEKLNEISSIGDSGHPQGPIWIDQPEFQNLLNKSTKIMAAINHDRVKIDQRIKYLLDKAID
jgi:hypothetical protein